jgi:glyoxalase family protein
MTNSNISGIHHITAIAGDVQANVDFYSGVLGLRLIKKTVNFDAPDTYHLYYGDRTGNPGTVLTFFPWGSDAWRGKAGTGQVTVISFAVPVDALPYWMERLELEDVSFQGPLRRFDEEVITLRDPDGIQLELVAAKNNRGTPWENGTIPSDKAIRGFHSATLAVRDFKRTAQLLIDSFDFLLEEESGNRNRFVNKNSDIGNIVDLLELPQVSTGSTGVGTIHHIAWRIAGEQEQQEKRSELLELGYQVTSVKDRNYFRSIYFREPENILFELATDTPGFLTDEKEEVLGTGLKLPGWLEAQRLDIEARLPRIKITGRSRQVVRESQ